MSDRLKPCPFCGNADQKEIRHESMNDARWMRCQKCSATSSWVWFKESVYIPTKSKKPDMTKIRSIWRKDTEKAWNTRPEEAAMQKDIDTLWESNGTSDKEIGYLKDEIEQLKAQLIAETARQMACELECSRLAAENERLKAKVARLMEITDFMNDIGFSYKIDNHGDAYIHSDDYGDFYYSRKHHNEDVK